VPIALITGITGQDGHYLAAALLDAGYDVHGIVRASEQVSSDSVSVTSNHVVELSDHRAIDQLINELSPDEIYSLASISSVYQSWQEPVSTVEVNAVPVTQILESAWKLHSKGRGPRVVHASSAELFGNAEESPQNEKTVVRPTSPYGASKALAHLMVNVYRLRGLHASNAILYNHESPIRHTSFVTRKITSAAARISLGLQNSLVLGTLDSRRDWGWAPDYVKAMTLMAANTTPDDFVIATGETHSIADFVDVAFARAGVADWHKYVSLDEQFARPVDPIQQVGDSTKARIELGWAPSIGFAEVVERMVDNDLRIALSASK
jgi:GDPmannose 4,6-dehydratase